MRNHRALFNDRKVAALRPDDGDARTDFYDEALTGFGVRVSATGRKTWMVFPRIGGKMQRVTLRDPKTGKSTYPDVGLARARELAKLALQKATTGRDINAERAVARVQTFGALGIEYMDKHAKKNKKSWQRDGSILRCELAAWADKPVADIRRKDVRAVLDAMVERGAPVYANRVLSLVSKVLNFALDREWVEFNVAARMAKPTKEKSRSRVLNEREVAAVWAHLSRPPVNPGPAGRRPRIELWPLLTAWMRLRLVTAQRPGEILSMRWSDIDWRDNVWTIPEAVAKNGIEHRVPLSSLALDVLQPLKAACTDVDGFVFEGIRSPKDRANVLDGLTLPNLQLRDLRRTAATMMGDLRITDETIGRVLNHKKKTITGRVYNLARYDPEKRAALDALAAKLSDVVDGVKSEAA